PRRHRRSCVACRRGMAAAAVSAGGGGRHRGPPGPRGPPGGPRPRGPPPPPGGGGGGGPAPPPPPPPAPRGAAAAAARRRASGGREERVAGRVSASGESVARYLPRANVSAARVFRVGAHHVRHRGCPARSHPRSTPFPAPFRRLRKDSSIAPSAATAAARLFV